MKLTENTKVRVRVPKHLYEAIQAELDKKDEMKESDEMNEYVGMSPDQAQAMELAGQILAAVAAGTGLTAGIVNLAKKVKSKIQSKKSSSEEEPTEEINEWVGLNPADYDITTLMGLGLPILTALLSVAQQKLGPKVTSAIKSAIAKKKGGQEKPTEEMEETLDLDTLMEAVKDASKKKAEEKKKKELEAKKKKAEDDKKKKEADAKKKAVAAKKK